MACPGANSECVNTLGSFRCQCRAGFAENNGSCLGKCTSPELSHKSSVDSVLHVLDSDMNECEDSNNGCDGQCINTEGSYDCLCTNGRVWSADNRSCEGILWCIVLNSCSSHSIVCFSLSSWRGSFSEWYKCVWPSGSLY